MIELFFKLLVAHALADFSLQGDAMAKGKNRNRKPDYIPDGQKLIPCWPYWLSAHAFIHGGAVYIVTGSLLLGSIETVAHWAIDFAKCENWTNPHQDQILHIVCRIGYVLAV
jgi:hypothetical protein